MFLSKGNLAGCTLSRMTKMSHSWFDCPELLKQGHKCKLVIFIFLYSCELIVNALLYGNFGPFDFIHLFVKYKY